MYCVTVFYLLNIDFLMSISPASSMATSSEGYCHSPYLPLRGCLLVSRLASPWRNALSARSIFGATAHVSAPNSSTCCTTALNKFPEIRVVAPFLLSIPCILSQLFRNFAKFPATAGQSSSPAVITLPRYVNQGTDWIYCP